MEELAALRSLFFFKPEVLHHIHRFFWDHDLRWCIAVLTPDEIDYRFSLIQTAIGYRSFEEGVSKLKQVTGRDHCAVQRYIIGVIAGAVQLKFLAAVRSLLDFRYLAQMPQFDNNSLAEVEVALKAFHNNKSAILSADARQGSSGPLDHWEIPKLELLQHVVSSTRASGPIMQWTADVTEHAHVTEIKQPTRSGNNQNYHTQIVRHLNHNKRCLRFDIATHFASIEEDGSEEDDEAHEDEHEPDPETLNMKCYHLPSHPPINYFEVSKAIASSVVSTSVLPPRTFASSTTAFRLAFKPSLWISIDEAAELYGIPDLQSAVTDYFRRTNHSGFPVVENIQAWFKV